MKNSQSRITAFALAGLLAAGAAMAADAPPAHDPNAKGPQGDTIDSIKQLPDFGGVWEPINPPQSADEYKTKPPLTAAWAKRFDENKAALAAKKKIPSRDANCVSRGVPGDMWDKDTLLEFYYSPARVTIVDTTGWVRRIYTDGRDHADLVETFQGDSIGHWENGTLMIDTDSLDYNNEFISGLNQGRDSHVTEKVFLKDPNTLEIDTVMEASQALTAPYKHTQLYRRHKDWMQTEYDCVFNNKDKNHTIVR